MVDFECYNMTNMIKQFPYIFFQRIMPLPITSHTKDILKLIDKHQVSIIQGETGCGKSTQIPQMLLKHKISNRILATQPRRIAAINIAKRVAEETTTPLGSLVGYSISGEKVTSEDCRLTFCTTGFALQVRQFNCV